MKKKKPVGRPRKAPRVIIRNLVAKPRRRVWEHVEISSDNLGGTPQPIPPQPALLAIKERIEGQIHAADELRKRAAQLADTCYGNAEGGSGDDSVLPQPTGMIAYINFHLNQLNGLLVEISSQLSRLEGL